MQYKHIIVKLVGKAENVALIQLNRPKALNALCDELMLELGGALGVIAKDKTIGASS